VKKYCNKNTFKIALEIPTLKIYQIVAIKIWRHHLEIQFETKIRYEIISPYFQMKFRDEIPTWNFDMTFWYQISRWNFGKKFRYEISRWHLETKVRDEIWKLNFDIKFGDQISRWDFKMRFQDGISRWNFKVRDEKVCGENTQHGFVWKLTHSFGFNYHVIRLFDFWKILEKKIETIQTVENPFLYILDTAKKI